MKTSSSRDAIEVDIISGQAEIHKRCSHTAVRLVGRAVLSPPLGIHKIGAHGVTRLT